MNNNYDSIDKALNVESSIVDSDLKDKKIEVVNSKEEDIERDYEYTRANLYSLIEKGQEAINGIMELAGEGGSPRAYEVAGQLIKSVADTTDKLIDLQKKLKDVEDDSKKTTNNVTNNAVFVGSTSELQKMLKQGFLNNNNANNKNEEV
jgi:seryl-tRNA synthetase